jgi:hypothetical protein
MGNRYAWGEYWETKIPSQKAIIKSLLCKIINKGAVLIRYPFLKIPQDFLLFTSRTALPPFSSSSSRTKNFFHPAFSKERIFKRKTNGLYSLEPKIKIKMQSFKASPANHQLYCHSSYFHRYAPLSLSLSLTLSLSLSLYLWDCVLSG